MFRVSSPCRACEAVGAKFASGVWLCLGFVFCCSCCCSCGAPLVSRRSPVHLSSCFVHFLIVHVFFRFFNLFHFHHFPFLFVSVSFCSLPCTFESQPWLRASSAPNLPISCLAGPRCNKNPIETSATALVDSARRWSNHTTRLHLVLMCSLIRFHSSVQHQASQSDLLPLFTQQSRQQQKQNRRQWRRRLHTTSVTGNEDCVQGDRFARIFMVLRRGGEVQLPHPSAGGVLPAKIQISETVDTLSEYLVAVFLFEAQLEDHDTRCRSQTVQMRKPTNRTHHS